MSYSYNLEAEPHTESHQKASLSMKPVKKEKPKGFINWTIKAGKYFLYYLTQSKFELI